MKKIIFNSLNKTIPLTQGKNLDLFESKFKKYLKCKGNAYAVANGSNALDLTAILLNLKKMMKLFFQLILGVQQEYPTQGLELN